MSGERSKHFEQYKMLESMLCKTLSLFFTLRTFENQDYRLCFCNVSLRFVIETNSLYMYRHLMLRKSLKYKREVPRRVSIYRPISILPGFSKVHGRIMYKILTRIWFATNLLGSFAHIGREAISIVPKWIR